MTCECPKKKSTLAAMTTTPATITSRVNEIIELEANTDTDSGNARV